jgi:hypothetical protein
MNLDRHAMDKMRDMYLRDKMSTREIAEKSTECLGVKVSTYQAYAMLKKDGVQLRSISESVSRAMSTLDPDKSFMDEKTLEWVDGFLLGDGSILRSKRLCSGARFSIGSSENEWATFAMRGFAAYGATQPRENKRLDDPKNPNSTWSSVTWTHPDIVAQARRWYPDGKKEVPCDIRITPTSVLLWYLGDGSICSDLESNYSAVQLATCAFDPERIEQVLIPKLYTVGIDGVHEKAKNSIRIRTSSIGVFFDYIGRSSPISCYVHKFNVPKWLFLHRLADITKTPQEHWRAVYHIKKGTVKCSSSPGGKMFLFDDEQAAQLRLLLDDTGRAL